MTKTELIKGILELGNELDENHGIGSITIIDDMDRLVEKYTRELEMAPVVGSDHYLPYKADLEIKKMYKILFSFKKSYPEGGPPDWCEELVVMEAEGQDELNAKIAEYKNNDHCGYHEYIRLVNIIAL